MLSCDILKKKILKIDGKGYKAYKEIKGFYSFKNYLLYLDSIQGDPFASPSKVRIKVSQKEANFDKKLFSNYIRKIALEDFLHRKLYYYAQKASTKLGSGKSGLILVDKCCQEVLPRSVIKIDENYVEARMYIGLPARGRTILGKEAIKIFFDYLPEIINKSLFSQNLNLEDIIKHVNCIEDQEWLRSQLENLGLVAFIANNSLLARESGVSEKPLASAIPFIAPASLEKEINLPNQGKIKGLGIKKGITLITGGGFHGKSTLLKAIEKGVYNHIPGDGREGVITLASAVKIRAEDGRFIEKTNISPFISNLPLNINTQKFSTSNASGSTSQAANIIESIEAETKLLLLDEDTCATNFMIRDRRMQYLVNKENEPITPFIDRIKEIYNKFNISTILVLGGCGDYLDVADTVIMMKNYLPLDMTREAKKIIKEIPLTRIKENISEFKPIAPRKINKYSFSKIRKIKAKGTFQILIDKEVLDLSYLEQLVCPEQTNSIALIIEKLQKTLNNQKVSLVKAIDKIYDQIRTQGLDCLSPYAGQHPGSLALPRKQEIIAAINRYRKLKIVD